MIQAIETRYKGYRFRSRLEARWAVFFDAIKVPFRYEVEGFVLQSGRCYLPDFWIGENLILEVKPGKSHWPCNGWLAEMDEACFEDVLAMMEVCNNKGINGYVLFGDPWPGSYFLWPTSSFGYEIGESVWGTGRKESRELWAISNDGATCLYSPPDAKPDDKYPLSQSSELTSAFTAARSARFEHGEKG